MFRAPRCLTSGFASKQWPASRAYQWRVGTFGRAPGGPADPNEGDSRRRRARRADAAGQSRGVCDASSSDTTVPSTTLPTACCTTSRMRATLRRRHFSRRFAACERSNPARSSRRGSLRSPTTPAATGSAGASTIRATSCPTAPTPRRVPSSRRSPPTSRPAAPRDRRAAGKVSHGHHPLSSAGPAVRGDRQRAGSADGYGKDAPVSGQGAATQASGRNGGNGIMSMDERHDDALDRALFALPLEEPPADLRSSILRRLPSTGRYRRFRFGRSPSSARWCRRGLAGCIAYHGRRLALRAHRRTRSSRASPERFRT